MKYQVYELNVSYHKSQHIQSNNPSLGMQLQRALSFQSQEAQPTSIPCHETRLKVCKLLLHLYHM